MISIHSDGLRALAAPQILREKVLIALDIAHLFLTVAKKASHDLLQNKLSSFDPIVGENTCQVRGLHIICSSLSKDLLEEAEKVQNLAKRLLTLQNDYSNNPHSALSKIAPTDSLETILQKLELNIEISKPLAYCFRSFLLTHGKFFSMTKNLNEISGIDLQKLHAKVCKKTMPLNTLGVIIDRAKEEMSKETILFLQSLPLHPEVTEILGDRFIRKVITKSKLALSSSCAIYNFEAVLLMLTVLQIPILITEHRGNSFNLYFRSETPGAPPTPCEKPLNGPIFVLEGFSPLPEKDLQTAISKIGLIPLALANIAVVPQYSEDDHTSELPERAKAKILMYRELGEEWTKILQVVHTHAS